MKRKRVKPLIVLPPPEPAISDREPEPSDREPGAAPSDPHKPPERVRYAVSVGIIGTFHCHVLAPPGATDEQVKEAFYMNGPDDEKAVRDPDNVEWEFYSSPCRGNVCARLSASTDFDVYRDD